MLAIWIKRAAFDEILAQVVHSKFEPDLYTSESEWSKAVKTSLVRLQWDPDRHPWGARLERRAIQLGLRGSVLNAYARDRIVNIEDSPFVQQQRQNIKSDCAELYIPRETVYPIVDGNTATRLGLSTE